MLLWLIAYFNRQKAYYALLVTTLLPIPGSHKKFAFCNLLRNGSKGEKYFTFLFYTLILLSFFSNDINNHLSCNKWVT